MVSEAEKGGHEDERRDQGERNEKTGHRRPKDYLASVGWETLLFFAGLFIMIGALVKTGVIGDLAKLAADATGGNSLLAFWEFTKKGLVVTLITVLVAAPYLWLRYLVLV